jgi:hypothetical protein
MKERQEIGRLRFMAKKLSRDYWFRTLGKFLSYSGLGIFIAGIICGCWLKIGLGVITAVVGDIIHEYGEEE